MQNVRRIHFVGIGGAGMSGLARIANQLGFCVTGSDLVNSSTTEELEALGIKCYTGHRKENINGADLLVISSAIPAENVEILEASRRGIPVIHRADLLALLMKRQKGIAVAGAHGKTTTTSMIAVVLEKNRLDPTVVVGGELAEIGGNAKLGRGEYFVAEADESDGSFLKLDPYIEVVTNVEDDHLDYYRSVENIMAAFKEFIFKVPPSGLLVACLDDPAVTELLKEYCGPLCTYALSRSDADYVVTGIETRGRGTKGDVFFRGEFLGSLNLCVPGEHNLSNAVAAVAVGMFAGLSFSQIAWALKDFSGAGRRFQTLFEGYGITVVDDYAHHPSEIAATLKAARQVCTGRVLVVFQPHRYTRTAILGDRFGSAFRGADEIIICDIYSAGEKPIEGVTAKKIVDAVEKEEGKKVRYLPDKNEIITYLLKNVRSGDMILTMGAGNIWQTGREIAAALKER